MLDNLSLTANLVWATLESVIILGAGIKFFFTMKNRLDNLEAHTWKRNNGSSIADALHRLETNLKENTRETKKMSEKLAKLEGRFEQHVEEQF